MQFVDNLATFSLFVVPFLLHGARRHYFPADAGPRAWSVLPQTPFVWLWSIFWTFAAVGVFCAMRLMGWDRYSYSPLCWASFFVCFIVVSLVVWIVATRSYTWRGRYSNITFKRDSASEMSVHQRLTSDGNALPRVNSVKQSLGELAQALTKARPASAVASLIFASPWFGGDRHQLILRRLHAQLAASFPGCTIVPVTRNMGAFESTLVVFTARRQGRQWRKSASRSAGPGPARLVVSGYSVLRPAVGWP